MTRPATHQLYEELVKKKKRIDYLEDVVNMLKNLTMNNGISKYIRKHFLQLLLILIAACVSFAVLQRQVAANTKKIAEYPSADFFSLKFNNIDKKFNSIDKKLDEINVKIDSLEK